MLFFQLPVLPELVVTSGGGTRMRQALQRAGLPPEAVDRYVTPLQQPGAARAALNWYRGLPFSKPLRGKIQVPALYVYATGDAFLGRKAADLTGRYVAAPYRFEVLEGASHWIPEEKPETVAQLLLEHIKAPA
jgi:pimeloyl-ACP methyl ester carboxylesterase